MIGGLPTLPGRANNKERHVLPKMPGLNQELRRILASLENIKIIYNKYLIKN